MSIKKPIPSSQNSQQNQNGAMATVIVTVCAVIITLAVGYNWGYYQGTHKSLENTGFSVNNGVGVDDANEIRLYQGPVVKIEGNMLYITAKVYTNETITDKTVTINTADDTIFRKIDLSIPPFDPDEVNGEQENAREKVIGLNDIMIGDNIIADASENIFGKTNIRSYQITVLSTGQ
ncbi:MAG: hypothetical protein WCW66_03790 [Patescibacteria group bacterium]|jgi:DnaJ-class molecular chaperone